MSEKKSSSTGGNASTVGQAQTSVQAAATNAKQRKKQRMQMLNQPSEYVQSALPRNLSVVEYAQARLREMKDFTKFVRDGISTRRVYQTVTRHLRRRAMSFNIKRLPPHLRSAASREVARMESSAPSNKSQNAKATNTGTKTRRARRAPRALLIDRIRRATQNKWLETHLWMAKRMKMETMWGYRLARHMNDKATRAAFRLAQHRCTVRDISYMIMLELEGEEDVLLEALRLCVPSDHQLLEVGSKWLQESGEEKEAIEDLEESAFGLKQKDAARLGLASYASKAVLEGERAGTIKSLRYPIDESVYEFQSMKHLKPLAGDAVATSVRVLWMPRDNHSAVLKGSPDTLTSLGKAQSLRKVWLWLHPAAAMQAKALFECLALCVSEGGMRDSDGLTPKFGVQSLEGEFNIFRLTGHQSHAVLNSCLRVHPDSHAVGDGDVSIPGPRSLWNELASLRTPNSLHPGTILALKVTNPNAVVARVPRRRAVAGSDPTILPPGPNPVQPSTLSGLGAVLPSPNAQAVTLAPALALGVTATTPMAVAKATIPLPSPAPTISPALAEYLRKGTVPGSGQTQGTSSTVRDVIPSVSTSPLWYRGARRVLALRSPAGRKSQLLAKKYQLPATSSGMTDGTVSTSVPAQLRLWRHLTQGPRVSHRSQGLGYWVNEFEQPAVSSTGPSTAGASNNDKKQDAPSTLELLNAVQSGNKAMGSTGPTSTAPVDTQPSSSKYTLVTERTAAAIRARAKNVPKVCGGLATHILLVQRPSTSFITQKEADSRRHALGTGWDLIVPAGWGQVFFAALNHAGACVIGMREEAQFSSECGDPSFMLFEGGSSGDHDSIAGRLALERYDKLRRLEWFRTAPGRGKRVYWRLATDFPFGPTSPEAWALIATEGNYKGSVQECIRSRLSSRLAGLETCFEKDREVVSAPPHPIYLLDSASLVVSDRLQKAVKSHGVTALNAVRAALLCGLLTVPGARQQNGSEKAQAQLGAKRGWDPTGSKSGSETVSNKKVKPTSPELTSTADDKAKKVEEFDKLRNIVQRLTSYSPSVKVAKMLLENITLDTCWHPNTKQLCKENDEIEPLLYPRPAPVPEFPSDFPKSTKFTSTNLEGYLANEPFPLILASPLPTRDETMPKVPSTEMRARVWVIREWQRLTPTLRAVAWQEPLTPEIERDIYARVAEVVDALQKLSNSPNSKATAVALASKLQLYLSLGENDSANISASETANKALVAHVYLGARPLSLTYRSKAGLLSDTSALQHWAMQCLSRSEAVSVRNVLRASISSCVSPRATSSKYAASVRRNLKNESIGSSCHPMLAKLRNAADTLPSTDGIFKKAFREFCHFAATLWERNPAAFSTLLFAASLATPAHCASFAVSQGHPEARTFVLPVTIELLGKGSPKPHAMICLPMNETELPNWHAIATLAKEGQSYEHLEPEEPLRSQSVDSYLERLAADHLGAVASLLPATSRRTFGFLDYATYSMASGRSGAQLGTVTLMHTAELAFLVATGRCMSSLPSIIHKILRDFARLIAATESPLVLPPPLPLPIWLRNPGEVKYRAAMLKLT